MRMIKLAVLALTLTAAAWAGTSQPLATPYAAAKQERGEEKPRATSAPARACPWVGDNECDEPVIGTGLCAANTDVADCTYLRRGESDACPYARDGECDEPRFGTGACVMGSDRTDCGKVDHLRFRNDSCTQAFNGVCDEPGRGGDNSCAWRTDRADCVGRARPPRINDHFFGNDDRVRVDPTQYPWASVGVIKFTDEAACTATLIGPDVLVTAAHCINRPSGILARGVFTTAEGRAGGPYTANITDYYLNRAFNVRLFNSTLEVDGLDWALLRIDRDLGDELGFVTVRDLPGSAGQEALTTDLFQAGYAWDTGDQLSGHMGCRMIGFAADNTFTHECDTTRGDSGSPFLIRNGDQYELVGVDSRFRSNPGGSFIYVAVGAGAFERYVEDFTAGRLGANGRRGK